jgi:hypothetical protein
MRKIDHGLALAWLILLLKPETRAADYRGFIEAAQKGKKTRL